MIVLLFVLALDGCAGASHTPQDGPLPPPENAGPLAAQLILDGNRLFAEHHWTAAIENFNEATQAPFLFHSSLDS